MSPTIFLRHPVLLAGLACLTLNGCVVAVVGAAAAGGGYAMGQERGISGTVSDAAIKADITALWLKDNAQIESYVDLNVFEGRVLLTGGVPSPTIRDSAVADAWRVNGVKEVLNEIQIADRSTFGGTARDNWIQTRLRTQLIADADIRSLNFSLETVDGVVYVLGVARSQDELDRVLNYARTTPDVRRVVNYVRIRSGVGDDSGNLGYVPPPDRTAPAPPNAAGPVDVYTRPAAPNPTAIQTVPLQ